MFINMRFTLRFDHAQQEKFEDTKGVTRDLKWKVRQCNGQKEKDNRTNNDLQNTIQKTKDRTTRTPLKTGVDINCRSTINQ